MLTFLSVFPELLDINGDSQNAAVLEKRASWSGHDAITQTLSMGDAPPKSAPAIVIVGSGAESTLLQVLEGLLPYEDTFKAWAAQGVPFLAVGTGWELLSNQVEVRDGDHRRGVGIFPGSAHLAGSRVSDDIVVDADGCRLVGFENHIRDYLNDTGVPALGAVAYGRGNGGSRKPRVEGMRVGPSLGTHLHGPVLAKNPALADELLRRCIPTGYELGARAMRVDEIAQTARDQITTRLRLRPEASH